MTWVRLDDQFPRHPKLIRAGGDAAWLFVCGLCYCAEHLTDGLIPKAAVPMLSDRKRPQALARRLSEVGLWEDEGDSWRVHDYLTYQPSREKVLSERAASAERMRNSRSRRTNVAAQHDTQQEANCGRSSTVPSPSPYPSSKSSSSLTVVGGPAEDDDGVLAAACRTLAEREADRFCDIGNRTGWIKARTLSLVRQHADAAAGLLAQHPDLTAAQLVAFLDGSRPAPVDVREEARRLARNAVLSGEPMESWRARVAPEAWEAFTAEWQAAIGGEA